MRKSRSRQIDWTSLITPDIRSAFVTDVHQEIDSGSDFRLAVLQASVRHLPFKRHSTYSRLQDNPRILNVRKTVQRGCSRCGQASTEHNFIFFLSDVYTKCAEEFAQNKIDDIEKHALECRSADGWKAINLFCGRKFRFTNCVNAESIDDMKLGIENHYAAVLNQASSDSLINVFSDLSPLTNKYDYSFTIPEICIAFKPSRSNTAPGSDGMPTRVLQLCELEENLLNVLNSHSILSNNYNTVPDKWKHSIIVSFPRKGNSSSLEIQRGIVKSCAFARLTEKLLAHIRDVIEPQLLGVQSGFCAGRSTVDQTMALRCILDMCCVSKRMTTIIFVDFNKAFDSIDPCAIPIVLSKYGVSQLLIANVMLFCIGTSAVVATAHGKT